LSRFEGEGGRAAPVPDRVKPILQLHT
jgi:hypothetical protein